MKQDEENNNGTEVASTKVFVIAVGIICFLLYFLWVIAIFILGIKNSEEDLTVAMTGSFGDSFGILTAIMSGLAAYLVFLTLQTQKQELHLTRQELAETRIQNQVVAVETSFYKLVEMHGLNSSKLEFDLPNNRTIIGHAVVEHLVGKIVKRYKRSVDSSMPAGEDVLNESGNRDYYSVIHLLSDDDQASLLHSIQGLVNSIYRQYMTTYCNHLLAVLKYLEKNNELLGDKASLFVDVLRAQLSDYEIKFLVVIMVLEIDKRFNSFGTSGLLVTNDLDKFLFNVEDFRVKGLNTSFNQS